MTKEIRNDPFLADGTEETEEVQLLAHLLEFSHFLGAHVIVADLVRVEEVVVALEQVVVEEGQQLGLLHDVTTASSDKTICL